MAAFMILLLLGFVSSCASSTGNERVLCYQGVVVYDTERTQVLLSLNTTLDYCALGEKCGQFEWINADDLNRLSFVQSSFCIKETLTDCSDLDGVSNVHIVGQCFFRTCSTDGCNDFLNLLCDTGTIGYISDQKLVAFDVDARQKVCSVGQICGMFRFNNLNITNQSTNYIEHGLCVDPEQSPNCSELDSFYNGIGVVSNCIFEKCENSSCPQFTNSISDGRGFRCDIGVFIYSVEKTNFVFAKNVTYDPCDRWEACAIFRWLNTDTNGKQSYIESGFCANPFHASNLTCEFLADQPHVGQVDNCTIDTCSGDYCTQVSHLASPPECPDRPRIGDFQAFPGCTAKEFLDKVFSCVNGFVGELPFADKRQCRNYANQSLGCLDEVTRKCIQFRNDSVTPCPSVFDSISDAREIVRVIMVGGFGLVCEDLNEIDVVRQIVRNITETFFINLEPPICSDNQVLDDVSRSILDSIGKVIAAKNQAAVCRAFNELRTSFKDIINQRCSGLNHIDRFLTPMIGSYLADIVQLAVNITTNFIFNLETSKCDNAVENTSLLNCSHLYEKNDSCSTVQAWLCEYINWKLELFFTWLPLLSEYSNPNPYPVIECKNVDLKDLCINSFQQECRRSEDGCDVCYCLDHRYKDMEKIVEVYRRDWFHWRQAVQRYQDKMKMNHIVCSLD